MAVVALSLSYGYVLATTMTAHMGEPYMKLNDYVSDLRHVPVTSLVIGVVISCFFLIYPMLVNAVVQTLPESEKMLATQRACRFAYLVSGWMVVMGTCAMFLMAHHLSVGIAGFQQSAVLQFIAHLYMQSFVVLMIALGLAVMCFPYYVQHTILRASTQTSVQSVDMILGTQTRARNAAGKGRALPTRQNRHQTSISIARFSCPRTAEAHPSCM